MSHKYEQFTTRDGSKACGQCHGAEGSENHRVSAVEEMRDALHGFAELYDDDPAREIVRRYDEHGSLLVGAVGKMISAEEGGGQRWWDAWSEVKDAFDHSKVSQS